MNGWQRIGVVLSILWVITTLSYAIYERYAGDDSAKLLVEIVIIDAKTGASRPLPPPHDPPTWDDIRPVNPQERLEPRLPIWRLGTVIIAPLMLGWALVYLCLFVFRWIAAGFGNAGRREH